MSRAKAMYLAVGLGLAALVIGHGTWRYYARHLTRKVSIADIYAGRVAPGQAIWIPDAELATQYLHTTAYQDRDRTGNRAYRYTYAHDPASGRKLVVLIWRTSFPEVKERGDYLVTDVRGTLTRLLSSQRDEIQRGYSDRFTDPRELELYLDEMEYGSVSAGSLLGVLLALAGAAGSAYFAVRAARPERPAVRAAPLGPAVARSAGPRAGEIPVAERTRTCAGCGGTSPAASRNCSHCKAPVEVEYYVCGALPLQGFERLVPSVSSVLQVSDYQAREPLARVHTPIPYQHLESFHMKGAGSGAPYRLTSRGIGSLVTAQALVAALEERGVEALVVGSDELLSGPFPRSADELRPEGDALTCVFYQGADREERSMDWRRIALILFSASQPLRGTMTIAREAAASQPADPASYLIDIYERGDPEGVRIAERSFHRWEFLKLQGSERPADRFGRLLELLEGSARNADVHFVSGAYRGPSSPWRMNYYSRLAFLVGEKSGWEKQEGPPELEGYEVLEKVGEGAMGAVYRARQKLLGRPVAIKVISAHLAAQGKFVARFQTEARAVASLSHPNIVQVIDLAESRGRHFMVMEFVEGKTLMQIVREKGPLPQVQALRIGQQVAAALQHAWERGIIHRDVKPENIFVTPDGVAKLGDWGLAKDMEQDLGLTDTGAAIGTPYYMSPEQVRGRKDVDVRSDLYSLGATLFCVLTGVPPFRGGSAAEVAAKHLQAPAPDPRSVKPDLSEATATLLLRLLEKRPDARFASAGQAAEALGRAIEAAKARAATARGRR